MVLFLVVAECYCYCIQVMDHRPHAGLPFAMISSPFSTKEAYLSESREIERYPFPTHSGNRGYNYCNNSLPTVGYKWV